MISAVRLWMFVGGFCYGFSICNLLERHYLASFLLLLLSIVDVGIALAKDKKNGRWGG